MRQQSYNMKILHTVALYSPSIGGSQEVVRQISEHLASLGHDITVATSYDSSRVSKEINGIKIKSFKISGNEAVGITGEIKKYQKFVLNGKFDVILNYAAQSWSTDALIGILPKIKSKKIFVPCGFSNLKDKDYKIYFESMKKWITNYDSVVFTSKYYQDYEFISKYLNKHSIVIGNGADEREFNHLPSKSSIYSKLKIDPNHKIILNISSHVFSKNHSEAIKMFSSAKVFNTTLLIIANSFENPECRDKCKTSALWFNCNPWRLFDHKKIVVTALDRKDTLSAYLLSDVFLFPSKIECSPLVLYECLAAGLPFLSSDAGNAEEIVKLTKGGFIYSTTKDAIYKLEKLLLNPSLRKQFSQNGRKYWKSKATWKKISIKYLDLYKNLLRKV